jgi:hypothetical protein
MTENESQKGIQSEKAIRVLIICISSGIVISILYALQAHDLPSMISVAGVAFATAGAALLSGALLGFLFGIPRTLQQGTDANANQQNGDGTKNDSKSIGYQVNTNLEQISDWLTKILVGVGLTQLVAIPSFLQKFAEFTAPGLGNFSNSKVFAVALLIYFLICGFLISYLWTRLFLAGAFRQADLSAIGGLIAKVENKFSELEKQTEIDARALNLLQRQLNPSSDSKPIPQEELNKAILEASTNVKSQIFYQAENVRRENWQDIKNLPKMERTIPIFRALVASDRDNVYHANHGQLGYALKDQRQKNYPEAEAELTKAIELRGDWKKSGWSGWLAYEANRAICRINQDQDFLNDRASGEPLRKVILADLKAVSNLPDHGKRFSEEPSINAWLKLNKIKWSEIVSN